MENSDQELGILLFKYTLPPLSVPLAGLGNLVLIGLLAAGVVGRLRQGLIQERRSQTAPVALKPTLPVARG